jgi:hypothetical protein
MSTWETGKPDAPAKLRDARAEAALCFRASGVRSDRSAEIESALSAQAA